jgi:CHAT domain-containing protein
MGPTPRARSKLRWNTRLLSLVFLLLCCLAPGAGAQTEALARSQWADIDTLLALSRDGARLYAQDEVKLSGDQYCSQAVALADAGEFRESVRAASKALHLAETTGSPHLHATALRNLAIVYSYAGLLDKAAQFAREALRAPAPDPQVAGPAYKVLGDVQARRGHVADAVHDYETALAHSTERYAPLIRASLAHALVAAGTPASLERAAGLLAHAAPAGDPALDAQLQRTRAGLLLAQGRPEDAKAAYLALVADPRGADGAYYRLWAWDGVARSSLALGQADAAAQAFDQALADMDAVRARFRSEEFKMGLFSDLQSIFERALALQLRLGHPERAFAISEQSRSRALLDSVRGRVPPQPGAAPDATPADPPLATLQQTLHADETLVVFHSLPEQLQVWLVDAHGIGSRQLPITRGDLADRVGIVRTALAHALPDAAQLADELGAALLEPLQLPPGQRLIIVPHGALHYLPFQALRLHGRYLIETHPIAIAPSARVAAQLIGQPPPAPSLAAFGNPRIGDPFDLPGAQAEVQELAGMFARHQVFTREQATKTRFRQAVAQASIVHVAAHAVADQVDPLYSRILLATEDGRRSDLEAHEIMQLALRGTALVTLSACESGLGRIASGDEVQGFTRAFLQAGSTSLIASLWPVSDSATELLMRRLYRELSRGRDVQGAMQAAQLALLHDPRFAHPFFWAPFNLIGNWRLALMPGA